jgi:hypothetical protein
MKKIGVILLLLLLGGLAIGYYLYNKPKTDYTDIKAEVSITATELFNAFNQDEPKAMGLYQNKVLAVSGAVSLIEKNQKNETVIYLASEDPMFGIQFTMLGSDSVNYNKLELGNTTTLKGLCVGFTNDVVLTNATVQK